MKTQSSSWADALRTGKEHLITDLSNTVFGLSDLSFRWDKLGDDKDKYGLNLDTNRAKCLTFLTQSLLKNGLKLLEELYATPLELVSGIHKVPFYGFCLSPSIVGVLIYV